MPTVLALCLSLLVGAPAFGAEADQGVSGLAVLRGKPVPGAVVAAWKSLDDFGGRKPPVAVSRPASEGGQYRLPLPPGEYYLVAGSGTTWERTFAAQPGELTCFFGNNPVSVPPGQWVPLGFNMVAIRPDPPSVKGPGGISGTLTFEDGPLEKAYVFAYRPDQPRFRGPGHAFAPAGKGGAFQLRLGPGTYYLVGRKRQQGSITGPLSHGDYVGFYAGNPVVIAAGQQRVVSIEMVQRLDNLDGGEAGGALSEGGAGNAGRAALSMGYRGRVLDGSGTPRPGLRVMAYDAGSDGTGTPLFVSEPTDAFGGFSLPVPRPGTFLLIARERLGGKAGEGELYGRLEGKGITMRAMIAEVEIRVVPVPRAGEGR